MGCREDENPQNLMGELAWHTQRQNSEECWLKPRGRQRLTPRIVHTMSGHMHIYTHTQTGTHSTHTYHNTHTHKENMIHLWSMPFSEEFVCWIANVSVLQEALSLHRGKGGLWQSPSRDSVKLFLALLVENQKLFSLDKELRTDEMNDSIYRGYRCGGFQKSYLTTKFHPRMMTSWKRLHRVPFH